MKIQSLVFTLFLGLLSTQAQAFELHLKGLEEQLNCASNFQRWRAPTEPLSTDLPCKKSRQWQVYQEETQCPALLKHLVVQSFGRAKVIVKDSKRGDFQLDTSSLKFCNIRDIDPGAFDVQRLTTFCTHVQASNGQIYPAKLYAKTQGNLFCNQEEYRDILGVFIQF